MTGNSHAGNTLELNKHHGTTKENIKGLGPSCISKVGKNDNDEDKMHDYQYNNYFS